MTDAMRLTDAPEPYGYRTCTWVGCCNPAVHDHFDKQGASWARLCEKHHIEFETAVCGTPQQLLAGWVKAQGGPGVAAQRVLHGC